MKHLQTLRTKELQNRQQIISAKCWSQYKNAESNLQNKTTGSRNQLGKNLGNRGKKKKEKDDTSGRLEKSQMSKSTWPNQSSLCEKNENVCQSYETRNLSYKQIKLEDEKIENFNNKK